MNISSGIRRCVLVAGVVLFAVQNVTAQSRASATCVHSYCQQTAVRILFDGNFSVHPCDDFYEHSCGLFIRKQDIPPNSLTYSYPQIVTKKVQENLKHLLENPITPSDHILEKDAKELYAACMDTERIDRDGFKLFNYYMGVAGGWPMSMSKKEWSSIRKPWQSAHDYLARLTGVGALLDVRVLAHKPTNNVPMIHLDQPSYISGKYDPFMSPTQKSYYKQFITELATTFGMARGSTVNVNEAEKDANDLLEFREKLARNMAWGQNRRLDKYKYNLYTLEELQDWYANDTGLPVDRRINWKRFIRMALPIESVQLEDTEQVVLMDQVYIFNLMLVLGMAEVRTIVNHIQLHFLENHLNHAPIDVRNKVRRLHQRLTGFQGLSEDDRWKFCIAQHPMQHVLGKMYVEMKVYLTTKETVRLMAMHIKKTLENKISRSTWIDDLTKNKALSKLNKMEIVSGYPDWYSNDTIMLQYYAMLRVSEDSLSNALSYSRSEYAVETIPIRNPPPRDTSYNYPTDRTVIYLHEKNALHINAAMLQLPYFDEALPENVNYGGLGLLIATEIIHAIDFIGIHFDEKGMPNFWWGESRHAYFEKLGCIASKYTGRQQTILSPFNNKITDVLAVQLVTDSYLTRPTASPPQPALQLPGLTNYKDMDMFFLVIGSVACKKIDPEYNEILVEEDQYGLPNFKINVAMTESWEFSKAYGCYDYSIMNPQDKCKVWES